MRVLPASFFAAGLLLTATAWAESADSVLRELAQSGAIRPPQANETERWIEGASAPFRSRLSPKYRLDARFDFAITREITLPEGLAGANAKKFLVLPGVPAPRGHPGHSCIARMDGFAVNNVRFCLREDGEAIERLQALPSGQGCRMIDPPEKARIAGVSGYEPDGAKHGVGIKSVPHPVRVDVATPGDVVLVLNIYEPAIWQISYGPSTRIVGVVTADYKEGSVRGVGTDVPIVSVDTEGRRKRPPLSAECEPFNGSIARGHHGGPHTMLFDAQAKALTGRNLDSLVSGYKLKDVEVR
jgi:hypothetical protein